MKILKFPSLRQMYDWDCGANAIQSVLAYYGIDVRGQTIIEILGTTIKDGTSVVGMKKVPGKYGLRFEAGKMTVDDIKKYLDGGVPVILLVQAWSKKREVNWEEDWIDGHYVVAIGYDRNRLFFEDPSVFSRTYLTYQELEKRWHDVDAKGKKYLNWGMAVFGKDPDYDLSKIKHME